MDLENMNIEKATERCKALTNPEQGCWIGISNQKAIGTVLEELEKKDDQIEYVKNEYGRTIEEKDKVINEMAEEITEWLGTCPYDKYDWQDIDCEKVCEDNMKQCWVEYFTNKVEREGK